MFYLAIPIFLYAVVRIIFFKAKSDEASNDLGAYNAVYLAVMSGAAFLFGDYYTMNYRVKMCFEDRAYKERSVEDCVSNNKELIIDEIFYSLFN